MPPQQVIDTHIHLAIGWKEGGKGLKNAWLPDMPAGFQRDWAEADIKCGDGFEVTAFVFVECANQSAADEAKWVLDMVTDPSSKIKAVVANIPVPDGGAAVKAFLDGLRTADGVLPAGLKGGRAVLLGNPMPPADACLQPLYLEGLKELESAGLLWEWCCLPEAIPSLAKASAQFPDMTFVLDHLGHNSGGNDLETWAPALAELAKCKNVVAKLGAMEEWKVDDPAPYLDHALSVFGPDRVMAESNWFVSEAVGDAYDKSFGLVLQACKRAGYDQAQTDKVFAGNAKRVYSL